MLSSAAMSANDEIHHQAGNQYLNEAHDICQTVIGTLSSANYLSSATNNFLASEVFRQVQLALGFSVATPSNLPYFTGMIAGALQLVGGVLQINSAVSGGTYQPVATGISGAMDFAAGSQLIVLTAVSPFALGPIGLAVATGVTASKMWASFLDESRKVVDEQYWLKDSIEQLAFIKQNLTHEHREAKERHRLRDDLEKASLLKKKTTEDELSGETLNIMTDFIFYLAANRLQDTHLHAKKIEKEIFARLMIDFHDNGENSYLMQNMQVDTDFNMFTPERKACLKGIRKEFDPKKHGGHFQVLRETLIQQQYNTAFPKSVPADFQLNTFRNVAAKSKEDAWKVHARPKLVDALMMMMLCAGFVCLCVPVAQIFSPIFLLPASTYFFAMKLIPAGKSAYDCLSTFAEQRSNSINQADRYASCVKLFSGDPAKAKATNYEIDGSALLRASVRG